MKKDLVFKLKDKVGEVAAIFSNPNRINNSFLKEIFTPSAIKPVSETVALVEFDKAPSGKKALAVFYWINSGEGYWQYFFPTDSHILGFRKIEAALAEIEGFNFGKN